MIIPPGPQMDAGFIIVTIGLLRSQNGFNLTLNIIPQTYVRMYFNGFQVTALIQLDSLWKSVVLWNIYASKTPMLFFTENKFIIIPPDLQVDAGFITMRLGSITKCFCLCRGATGTR